MLRSAPEPSTDLADKRRHCWLNETDPSANHRIVWQVGTRGVSPAPANAAHATVNCHKCRAALRERARSPGGVTHAAAAKEALRAGRTHLHTCFEANTLTCDWESADWVCKGHACAQARTRTCTRIPAWTVLAQWHWKGSCWPQKPHLRSVPPRSLSGCVSRCHSPTQPSNYPVYTEGRGAVLRQALSAGFTGSEPIIQLPRRLLLWGVNTEP